MLPKGMVAAVVFPALVAVVLYPNTQPLAAVILGVVCPVGSTPPKRYQISTGPVVPKAAEKMLVIPVRNMGWLALIPNVMTDDPLSGIVVGIVEIVV